MPLVGLLKFVSFTRSLVIKFWATAPAVNALACRLKTQPPLGESGMLTGVVKSDAPVAEFI